MSADPFRRPPVLDIPWGERERWWTRTTRRLVERPLWAKPESLADLGELVAQFCEGKLLETPDHGGPREPETVEIAAPLAHANRQGFVTDCSQPGYGRNERGNEQRAAVEGWATPATVAKLRRLVEGTRLQIQVATKRPRRTDYSPAVNVSRSVDPDGIHEHTAFGAVPGRREHFADLGRSDLTEGACYVTVYDPQWGAESLLWDRLGQADWDLADQRRGRWFDEKPITTTGSAGGAMASIEEVRGMIMAGCESADEATAAIQQAIAALERSLGMFTGAMEGSGRDDCAEAKALIAQAIADLEDVQRGASAGSTAAEGVGNRL